MQALPTLPSMQPLLAQSLGGPGSGWPSPVTTSHNNPLDEDFDSTLAGSPGAILAGAGVGMLANAGLDRFYGQPTGTSKSELIKHSPLARAAHWLDEQPGLKQVNHWLETHQPKVLTDRTWQTVLNHRLPAELEKGLLQDHLDALTTWSETILPQKLKDFESNPNTKERCQKFIQAVQTHLDPQKLERLEQLEPALGKLKNALAEGELNGEEVLKQLKPADKMLLGLKRRLLTRLNNHFMPTYRQEFALLEQMKLKPIGRTLVSATTVLRRVMSGSVINPGAQSAEKGVKHALEGKGVLQAAKKLSGRSMGFLGRQFGPLMAGLFVFTPAFDEARKADPSERGKAFVKGLLGVGLGNFLGWELGLALLNKTQWVTHTLNRVRPGVAIAPVLGLTVGGLLTELLAVIAGGGFVQKLGEGISNLVVGPVQRDPLAKMRAEGKAVPSILSHRLKLPDLTAPAPATLPSHSQSGAEKPEVPGEKTKDNRKNAFASSALATPPPLQQINNALSSLPDKVSTTLTKAEANLPGILPLGKQPDSLPNPVASLVSNASDKSENKIPAGVALSDDDLKTLMTPQSGLAR